MTPTAWIAIALLTVGTVAIKAVGPIALGGRELSPPASAVIARLVTETAVGAARRALSPPAHVPAIRPALVHRLHAAAAEARAVGVRHLGPWADVLLPRAAAAVLSHLDVAGLDADVIEDDDLEARVVRGRHSVARVR